MKRFSLALLSSILAFVFVIPAFAQETFGLTAAEFDGLVAANANSSAQEQWTLDYTVDFSLTGVEATPITATLSGTGALDLPNEALSLSINGTVVGGGASVPLDGELRVIGQAVYFRATDPTTNADTGWFYIEDIDAVMEGVDDLTSNPEGLIDAFTENFIEGFAGGAGISVDEVNTDALLSSLTALANLNPADFIAMAFDGNTYTTSLSMVNLVNSSAVSESVLGLVQGMGEETTEAELAAVIAILAVLLEDTSISASQTVNADGLITQTVLDVQSTLDPSALGESGEIITIGLNNTINLAYGQPAAVEVPANAIPIPIEAIDGTLSGLSGSDAPATVVTDNPATVTADTPTTLTLPEGLPVSVGFSGNGTYSIEVRGLDGADTYVTVTDSAGNTIGYNDDHGTSRDLATFDSALEELAISGEVTIEINRYSSDATNVELLVITEGGAVGDTGDTDPANATTLTVGTPSVVTLPNGVGATVDLLLTANGEVSITAKGVDGVDPTLEVLDSTGQSLGYNDDHGTTIGGLGAFDSALEKLPINGTVTVRVSKFGETGGQVEVLAVGPASVTDNNSSSGGGASNFTNFTCNSIGQDVPGTVGTTVNGTCPAGCGAGAIWGTAVYTDDSNICSAAQHSGAVTQANGGSFLLIVTAGQSIYPASTQNGITSQEWGEWGRSITLVPLAGGAAADANANSNVNATTYDFPNGVTFQAPNYLTLDSETDILTLFSLPEAGGAVQVYETQSLFGTVDMGMDFYKDTYGASAAATWGFSYNKANFQDVTVNGRTLSVMDFIGKSVDRPINGLVAIVPYTNGGYGYIIAFAFSPAPATFRDDVIALAGSLDN